MREPWVAYVIVGLVSFFMLLGKYLIARGDKKKEDKSDAND